jgi:ABC-type enterochelin transport system ATPase subunit
MHTPFAIEARSLRKSYGTQLVIDGTDLEGPAGTVFALLGPNYPEGHWITRERERLTNAIDRVAGNEPS